jgi:hypothetical protein
MLDFHKYLMRHGECWISEILDGVERHHGLRIAENISLEERWDFLMNDIRPAQSQQLAA